MAEADRQHWDVRYTDATPKAPSPPSAFADHVADLPSSGRALDVACGAGQGAVWLALRGLRVHGLDVSPVAISRSRELATRSGVADRCEFEVVDLDEGLPPGPRVDLVMCHLFRARHLYEALVQRLLPAGILAIAVLSEVDATAGRHRAEPGELRRAFATLDVLSEGERDGRAWLIGRRKL